MIEAEAKKKWCPMVRAGTKGSNFFVSGNWQGNEITEIDTREYTRCIGSACMMWRWSMLADDDGQALGITAKSKTNGYCGLAGRS